jgi:hypothetical protein
MAASSSAYADFSSSCLEYNGSPEVLIVQLEAMLPFLIQAG